MVKNPLIGPCEAIKMGLKKSESDAVIIYPADDFFNAKILDTMYEYKNSGYDIVCPSRFIQGGMIKNCPIIKFLIVKQFSILYYISVYKTTNGWTFVRGYW